jgi:hypothetical protein
MRFVAGVTVVLALVGCTNSAAPRSVWDTLDRNESHWRAQRIADYDYDLTMGSAWFPNKTFRIEVRGGLASKITDLTSTTQPAQPPSPYTLDSLFARARHDLIGGAGYQYKLTLKFNAQYGFLTTLNGDIPQAVDDEYWISTTNFVRR